MKRIFLVDDDASVGEALGNLLRQAGFACETYLSGERAVRALQGAGGDADLIITDVKMPGISGMQLLARVRENWPEIPVVMLTAHGSVPLAVEAMRRGAVDFLLKPCEREVLLVAVESALLKSPQQSHHQGDIWPGISPVMRELAAKVARTARSGATVMIRGESGSGKELVAAKVHELSDRGERELVVVDCGALPENLIESELFGHQRGAFTGASADKPGRAELADQSTLFLDEVGELALTVQAKLLRLLQRREFTRVGGTRPQTADIRFVSATHRDLEAMVREGSFREDLYFRLNVVPLRVPSLRERSEDIIPLAQHFLSSLSARYQRPALALEESASEVLLTHTWPGNVRELQHVMERVVVLCESEVLDADELRRHLPSSHQPGGRVEDATSSMSKHVEHAEREAVVRALEQSNQNKTLAARLLGISRRTLYNKLHELNIELRGG